MPSYILRGRLALVTSGSMALQTGSADELGFIWMRTSLITVQTIDLGLILEMVNSERYIFVIRSSA